MDDILKKFGQRLKELRKSKGLTQKEMANLMDMTDRNYQRFEYGKYPPQRCVFWLTSSASPPTTCWAAVNPPPKKRSDPLWISFA